METFAQLLKEWSRRNQEYTRIVLNGPQGNIGATPKDVIWSLNKVKLYRYRPTKKVGSFPPILMVYALINRAYILDLAPGMSMVEYLLEQGYDVYLLDWGTPGLEDRDLSFADYICKYLPRAVKKVQRASSNQEFSMLGYCMGGTMAAMYAALYPDAGLRNLILLASPIDFSLTPSFGRLLQTPEFDPVKLEETLGLVPMFGSQWAGQWLDLAYGGLNLWNNVLNEKFVQNWVPMHHWRKDSPPIPGALFRQWIQDCYQENKLVQNRMSIGGNLVRLDQIKANLLAIGATHDVVVLPQQVKAIMDCTGSESKEYIQVDAGHASLTVGPPGVKVTWPKIAQWLASRPS